MALPKNSNSDSNSCTDERNFSRQDLQWLPYKRSASKSGWSVQGRLRKYKRYDLIGNDPGEEAGART